MPFSLSLLLILLDARTKLETLSEFFDLSRDFGIFNSFFLLSGFLFCLSLQSHEKFFIEYSTTFTLIYFSFFFLLMFYILFIHNQNTSTTKIERMTCTANERTNESCETPKKHKNFLRYETKSVGYGVLWNTRNRSFTAFNHKLLLLTIGREKKKWKCDYVHTGLTCSAFQHETTCSFNGKKTKNVQTESKKSMFQRDWV